MAAIAIKLAVLIFLTFAISEIAFASDAANPQPGTSRQAYMGQVNEQMRKELSSALRKKLKLGRNLIITKVESSGNFNRHVFDYTLTYEGKKSRRTYKVHCVTDKNFKIQTCNPKEISRVDKKPK